MKNSIQFTAAQTHTPILPSSHSIYILLILKDVFIKSVLCVLFNNTVNTITEANVLIYFKLLITYVNNEYYE